MPRKSNQEVTPKITGGPAWPPSQIDGDAGNRHRIDPPAAAVQSHFQQPPMQRQPPVQRQPFDKVAGVNLPPIEAQPQLLLNDAQYERDAMCEALRAELASTEIHMNVLRERSSLIPPSAIL